MVKYVKTEQGYVDASIFAPAQFKPEGKSYLTFSSPKNFTLEVNNRTKNWDGILEYFASDKTWTVWDGTTILSGHNNDGEYVLYLRGTGNTKITGMGTNINWIITGTDIKCIGNIENLLDYATVASGKHPTMAKFCYSQMFYGCTSLTQAPELPATTLAKSCYFSMFSNCTALTQAPTLPATTLEANCYNNMFYGCTSLTQAPALPATTLTEGCYGGMFSGCTAFTQAPALPATTLENACYRSMFQGCTSLKLSSTKTGEYTQEYRIPSSGTGTIHGYALTDMFVSTGGTFTGTPAINTTYYLSTDNMIVRDTEIATLNGYVGSMIDNSVSNPLNITGATVGQIAKITAVDESGKPTSWEAVDDRLPKVTSSDAGNVLGVEQIGEHEYGYALTHMPTLNDFIPLGITNASPGQFAKVSFVDDFGSPTAWEAADIYEKPTSGIPKTDLADDVQTSLNKADAAISYDSQTLTEEHKSQARTNIGAGQPIFAVNVTEVSQGGGYTADKTAAEIEAAYQAGRTIVCKTQADFWISSIPVELPLVSRNQERVFIFAVDQLMGENAICTITVNISDSGVEANTREVEIYKRPVGGIPKSDLEQSVQTSLAKADTAISLGLTAATPGQIIKVKTVQDGKPTEWEAVDMPSGSDEWELIAHINVADDVEKDVTVWEYNNLPRYKYIAYKKVNLVGSGDQTESGCTIQINNESSQPSGMTYGKSGSPQNCIGMIYVMPFGWTHYKTVDAILPNNIALGGFSAMLTALPLSDNAITSIKLSAHTTYKIASGEIWLYGKKG